MPWATRVGNLQDYWDVIEKYDVLQGGFIWDWVDQGLLTTMTKEKNSGPMAGILDPDTVPSDGNFCNNGLVDPDRGIKPSSWRSRKYTSISDLNQLTLRGELFPSETNILSLTWTGFIFSGKSGQMVKASDRGPLIMLI